MPLTKPFAVATEGPTIDGRQITRQQIEDMAKNYNPEVYTALVNLEHLIGWAPDSVFSAYGKVISLDTRETEVFGEKRLQLTAVANVSPSAVELQKKGQKAFASVEIMPNFTGKGFAYLTGLALTDSPASVKTEAMKFSSFSDRGQPEHYGFPAEITLEIASTEAAPDTEKPSLGEQLYSKVKDLLGLAGKSTDARFADTAQAVTALAESQRDLLKRADALSTSVNEMASRLATIKAGWHAREAEFARLTQMLAAQPGDPSRPPATGTKSTVQTDC